MRYGDLTPIIARIEATQEEKTREILATAHQEAQKVSAEVLAEGQARLAKRKQRFDKQLQTKKKQALIRLKMQRQLEVNCYKQKLIEQEIQYCLAEMKQMPTANFCQWLQYYLEKEKERPRIRVSQERFSEVMAAFPNDLVESDPTLVAGFILSYERFDVNQELSQVIRFKKQELLRKMGIYLFEEDGL